MSSQADRAMVSPAALLPELSPGCGVPHAFPSALHCAGTWNGT